MSKLQHHGHDTAGPAGPARKAEVLEVHRRAGRHFEAADVRSFVREQGSGPAVLCFHGMIGSSFLYRKVLTELAIRGMRGVAFDLPGFGLADRRRVATTAGQASGSSAWRPSTSSAWPAQCPGVPLHRQGHPKIISNRSAEMIFRTHP